MTGATFGRKGMAAAAPVGRRAQFVTSAAPSARDEIEECREAFLAAERTRADATAEADPIASAARAKEVGLPVFAGRKSVATAYSLLAWYVFAPQCISTLAVVKRETNSWRYPLLMAAYLFALAYAASFVTYRAVLALTT